MCPPNYTQKDDVCLPPKPPTPQCPYNFNWNGQFCEVAQTVCKSGVFRNGKCEQEKYDCPTGFNKIENQCIKRVSTITIIIHLINNKHCVLSQVPFCPIGYTMMSSGSCSRTTHRCPPGSYSQNNQCVKMEQNCPPGTTLNGSQCFSEEITFKTIYETKYVDQVIEPRPIVQPIRPIVSTCQTGVCAQNTCTSATCIQNPCPFNTCIPSYH